MEKNLDKSKYDIFINNLGNGNEFEVTYKGVWYFISGDFVPYGGYFIHKYHESGCECAYADIEEFKEKATIGGVLLKDAIEDIVFDFYSCEPFKVY